MEEMESDSLQARALEPRSDEGRSSRVREQLCSSLRAGWEREERKRGEEKEGLYK